MGTVILNIKTFGLAIFVLLASLIGMTIVYRHPKRSCHRCGAAVRLTARRCRYCGYDFAPISFRR